MILPIRPVCHPGEKEESEKNLTDLCFNFITKDHMKTASSFPPSKIRRKVDNEEATFESATMLTELKNVPHVRDRKPIQLPTCGPFFQESNKSHEAAKTDKGDQPDFPFHDEVAIFNVSSTHRTVAIQVQPKNTTPLRPFRSCIHRQSTASQTHRVHPDCRFPVVQDTTGVKISVVENEDTDRKITSFVGGAVFNTGKEIGPDAP